MKITRQTTLKEVKDQTKKTLENLIQNQSADSNEKDSSAIELFEIMRNISSKNYDKYTSERFANIIVILKHITNLSEEEILKNMKETITYKEIISKNECFLYESYPANLEDMIEEWKEKGTPVLGEITEEQIDDAIIWLRDNYN